MFLVVSLASVLWLGAASAEPRSAHAKRNAGAKSAPAAASTGKQKVIRLDAITVEGRIQKPQAFYILQRSNLNFEELNRSESFLPKVVKSVEKDPF